MTKIRLRQFIAQKITLVDEETSYDVAFDREYLFESLHEGSLDAPQVGSLRVIAGVLCYVAWRGLEWKRSRHGLLGLLGFGKRMFLCYWRPVDAEGLDGVDKYKKEVIAEMLARNLFWTISIGEK